MDLPWTRGDHQKNAYFSIFNSPRLCG